MVLLYLVSAIGIVFVSLFFVALCREAKSAKKYRVLYVSGGMSGETELRTTTGKKHRVIKVF